MKKLFLTFITILSIGLLAACGNSGETSVNEAAGSKEEKKELTIGATAGPYSDMVTKAIQPILETKGYKVKVVEFSDYVQPNIALSKGSLDANLFQHKIYMENFAEEKGLELSEVQSVPTAPMGIYSNEFSSIEDITEGSEIAVPNDPVNLARTLLMLQDAGLITIDENVDPLTVSEKDIKENPKNLQVKPIEAAQLPRAVDSVALAAVPGNFALAAKMDLLDAIKLENMPDDYRNRVVVNTEDLDQKFVQDLKEVIESEEFEKVIDEQFQGFGKPNWMVSK